MSHRYTDVDTDVLEDFYSCQGQSSQSAGDNFRKDEKVKRFLPVTFWQHRVQ